MKIALSILGLVALLCLGAGAYLYLTPAEDPAMSQFSETKKAAIAARASKQAEDEKKERQLLNAHQSAKSEATSQQNAEQ